MALQVSKHLDASTVLGYIWLDVVRLALLGLANKNRAHKVGSATLFTAHNSRARF